MNGLISSCKRLRESQNVSERVDTRGLDAADGCEDGIMESGTQTWENFNRLCLTTFDKNGYVYLYILFYFINNIYF